MAKRLCHPLDYQLIVSSKSNQSPNTALEKAYLSRFRQLIETTNAQLSEQFNLPYTRAKSAWGLMSRLIHKLTAHTLAIYLNSMADRPLLVIKSITF
ncbi:hypothetical protein IC229_05010 [Spirosoma sp. BT702]|uniref:Transposase n=1 Tax=Spirosoma profusum TaxID=2771354 RepID=A0A926XTF9_9BACT|nr:hypothetical protein [Spirosoma profusum]MBD2699983.1 hypothetical protein [Spirosoma profusum]